MAFARFMASPLGRGVRIVAGLAMMVVGFGLIGGTGGLVLGIAGLLPLAAGAMNFCTISALIGAPLSGRKALQSSTH